MLPPPPGCPRRRPVTGIPALNGAGADYRSLPGTRRSPCLGVAAKAASVQQLTLQGREELSHSALSYGRPPNRSTVARQPPCTAPRTRSTCTANPGRCGEPLPAAVAARWPCSAHPGPVRCAGGRPSTSPPPGDSRIQHHRHVQKPRPRPYIGDVGHPQPIGAGGAEVPIDQIRRHAGSALLARGGFVERLRLAPAIPARRIRPASRRSARRRPATRRGCAAVRPRGWRPDRLDSLRQVRARADGTRRRSTTQHPILAASTRLMSRSLGRSM